MAGYPFGFAGILGLSNIGPCRVDARGAKIVAGYQVTELVWTQTQHKSIFPSHAIANAGFVGTICTGSRAVLTSVLFNSVEEFREKFPRNGDDLGVTQGDGIDLALHLHLF